MDRPCCTRRVILRPTWKRFRPELSLSPRRFPCADCVRWKALEAGDGRGVAGVGQDCPQEPGNVSVGDQIPVDSTARRV